MKLVVFDMGHVFVKFNWDVVCQGFARRAQIPRDQFSHVLKELGGLHYEKGKISTAAFLDEINKLLKIQLDLSEFTQLWNATLEEDQEMVALMQRISKERPLYLLSNTNESHYNYLQARFNIARHFKELILSYKLGYCKPEPEIYQEVFKRSSLSASDCLFIDDLAQNVQAAEGLGMKTILYTNTEDLRRRLPEFGVTV